MSEILQRTFAYIWQGKLQSSTYPWEVIRPKRSFDIKLSIVLLATKNNSVVITSIPWVLQYCFEGHACMVETQTAIFINSINSLFQLHLYLLSASWRTRVASWRIMAYFTQVAILGALYYYPTSLFHCTGNHCNSLEGSIAEYSIYFPGGEFRRADINSVLLSVAFGLQTNHSEHSNMVGYQYNSPYMTTRVTCPSLFHG